MSHSEQPFAELGEDVTVSLPAPSKWPIILAGGVTLIFATIVTHPLAGLVGIAMSLISARGWARESFIGGGRHVDLPLEGATPVVAPAPASFQPRRLGEEGHRVRIPIEVHPFASGVVGGIVGALAMAVAACLYGALVEGSIWFPINLLSAAIIPSLDGASHAQLAQYHQTAFILAVVIHGGLAISMGLLYVALLPMVSKHPLFVGGVLMPAIWSGLAWASFGVAAPMLKEHVNWIWFALSQGVFGFTTALVVIRFKRVPTRQTWLPENIGQGLGDDEAPSDKPAPSDEKAPDLGQTLVSEGEPPATEDETPTAPQDDEGEA